MKKLKEILKNIEIVSITRTENIKINSVNFDSRKIESGDLFVAVRGTQVDGHIFIDQVIENGAVAVVCEEIPKNLKKNVTYIIVKDSKYALGFICSNYFDNPSSKLKLTGVTGTNGKTTVVTLLHKLFTKLGYHCGLLSTIENKIGETVISSTHTTPDAFQINKLLNKMVKQGCSHCFMEVSSHAIDQNRIAGLDFTGAVFTNITHDHLDYHKTFDSYLKSKKKFFDELSDRAFALSNIDDKNGQFVLQNTKALKNTYSLKKPSDYKTKIIENQIEGLQLNINNKDIWFKLIGEFNAYNLISVFATAVLLGENEAEVLQSLSEIEGPEGRFEYIKSSNQILGIVDYAHTPDALENILKTISAIRKNYERIITVCGAGGDRDKRKRSLMGKIATRLSDKVILTSDNPRSENPEKIIEEMKESFDTEDKMKTLSITNREEAIKTACALAQPGDIILVAGKGHEKYQEIKGIKYPFNDKQILKDILTKR